MNSLLPERYLPIGNTSSVNFLRTKSQSLITIITLMMVVTFQTYGQSDWTLLKEEQGVKVFYKIAECDKQVTADPTDLESLIDSYELFQLKIVNENAGEKSITFSKDTKIDDSSQLETLTVNVGTTTLESCDSAPKIILTRREGDNRPTAVTDFLKAFVFTVNN